MWDSLYAILKAGDDGVTVQDEVAFSFFVVSYVNIGVARCVAK